uniref:Uncharacterized protein n=1 Tax=Rhizophora mucronata TaxID=61149 RepID=A0A2P2MJS7_RHIMU
MRRSCQFDLSSIFASIYFSSH